MPKELLLETELKPGEVYDYWSGRPQGRIVVLAILRKKIFWIFKSSFDVWALGGNRGKKAKAKEDVRLGLEQGPNVGFEFAKQQIDSKTFAKFKAACGF